MHEADLMEVSFFSPPSHDQTFNIRKPKYIKYLEFFFVYFMDDPMCEDHDWKLYRYVKYWISNPSRKGGKEMDLLCWWHIHLFPIH